MIGDNPQIGGRLSISKDAVLTTNYLDDYTVRGDVFDISLSLALTSGVPVYFTSEILEASRPQVNAAFLLPLSILATAGYLTLNIYEDTGYTGGSVLTPINRNRTSSKTALSTIKQGATGSTKGTLLWTFLFGTAGLPQGGGGGGGSSANSIILNKSKRYLYELIPSANLQAGIIAEFAEI